MVWGLFFFAVMPALAWVGWGGWPAGPPGLVLLAVVYAAGVLAMRAVFRRAG